MLITKTASRTVGSMGEAEQGDLVHPQEHPRTEREGQDRRRREGEGAQRRAGVELAEAGKDQGEEGRRERGPRARSRALRVRASRVGYSDPPNRAASARRCPRDPSRPPVPRPNVPTRQLEARLRRPGARDPGPLARPADVRPAPRAERRRPDVELPRRPDHGQQPDGRPSRLGPRLQGPLPALPRDARRGPALPERVRLPGPVGRGQRRARPRVHLQAGHRGVRDRRVRHAVQAARPDLRRAPDRAVDPARHVDGLERPRTSCAGCATCSARTRPRSTTIQGPQGPVTDTVEMLVGRLGMPEHRRQLLHVQQREQRPDLGVPGRVPPARLAVQGPRHDAVVRALRHRHLADGDERGLPGPRGPRADGPLPAGRPAGREPAGLDHDALDADLERGGGRRRRLRYVRVRQGDDDVLARQGHAQDGARRARSRSSRRSPGATWSAGATRARSTSWRRSGPRSRQARDDPRPGRTSIGSCLGARSARTRAPASSTSPRAAARRTSSWASRSACRSSRRSTRAASSSTASGWLSGRDVPRRRRADRRAPPSARAGSIASRPINHRYPHCWRCGTPLRLPPGRRVVHQHGAAVRPAARDADRRAGRRQPALPDHGRRRPDPVDPGLRLRARARLAPQHARLDDQQEALLGPGAADLRLRRVRDDRGHRRPRGAPRRGRSRAGRRSRATRRTGRMSTRSRSRARAAARRSSGSRTSAIRGSTPGSCRSRRSTTARTPSTGRSGSRPTSSPRASPASSATGSTRCWRCRTVLRREPPFKTIFGYALVFAEDGRPMHKSWGNAIEFDEAADRMGVDVMRWMFAKARPEENILFGWHAADEARRELLDPVERVRVLRDLRPAGRLEPGSRRAPPVAEPAASSIAGSCRARPAPRPPSRSACATSTRSARPARCRRYLDGLSTWYLRLSRRRFSRSDDRADRDAAFATLHEALVATRPDARADPAVPGRGDLRQSRRRRCSRTRPTAST